MKTPLPRTLNHPLRLPGFLAGLFGFVPGLYAGQAIFPGRIQNEVLALYLVVALFLEAVCAAWLLRRVRHPRFFVLWILGTHLLTFPVFLVAVWLLQSIFHDFTIALAEGLVILGEGWLVFKLCRRAAFPVHLTPPALGQCWYVALIANACSLLVFWLLLVPFTRVFG